MTAFMRPAVPRRRLGPRLRACSFPIHPVALIAFLLIQSAPAPAAEDVAQKEAYLNTLSGMPAGVDASPLPNYSGDFVSLSAEGSWHRPAGALASAYNSAAVAAEPPADCSSQSIVHYARRAPDAFKAQKNGLLYGVRTHTPATRVTTRYWDMPGFNSCALVVYAILKRAGCGWAKYTANAKAIYDMAHRNGWRPSKTQKGGCMVAWNSRWEGSRARIGARQKQAKGGSTRFRHVGIATGAWLSVDNSSWRSRPTTYFTYRPLMYEPPIFLCPPKSSSNKQANTDAE